MKIHLKTFGCSANTAESEMMAGLLSKHHDMVDSQTDSDVVVINSCTVKGDETVLKEIRALKQQKPAVQLVIGGCLSPTLRASVKEMDPGASFLSTHNLTSISRILGGEKETNTQKIGLPRVRNNSTIGILPISNGCLDHCTYCSTKTIKGNLVSFSPDDIVADAQKMIREGCTQIWLTSQDNSCYGLDIGTNLPDLVRRITALPGNFMIRIGMGNPTYFMEYVDDLIEVLNDPKVFKFVHIPIQAGSDSVLAKMSRRYTAQEYTVLIQHIKRTIPHCTIATDIIVGFPGETDEDFSQTLHIVKALSFDIVNISRFVPRKGTVAYAMDGQVHGRIKKDRSRALTTVFETESCNQNRQLVGWTGDVIVEKKGKDNTTLTRNSSYKPIVIAGTYAPGVKLRVKVRESTTYHVMGDVVRTVLPLI
jgi:MiaB-like tRNA modifying enzyme